MNLPNITIEKLLEAGVHFGHNISRWNPKMEQYIFGVRNKIHIIDLRITLLLINAALTKLHEVVSKSGKILIVGTKKQCSSVIKEVSLETQQYYVNKRWLGGTLTNWKTISKSINKLEELENILQQATDDNDIGKESILDALTDVVRDAKGNDSLDFNFNVHTNITKSQAIIRELNHALDLKNGGELGENLAGLYDYFDNRLQEANMKKDKLIIEEILERIGELRDAWRESLSKQTSDLVIDTPEPAHTSNPHDPNPKPPIDAPSESSGLSLIG